MQDEKLCVKWNDNLQERLQTSFGELRDDSDFTDVTLACEDQSVKAHKVILASSSPFFKSLLKAHPHPQPLVYLRGVKAEDLTAIVDFIYLGEANILQEQLERFLTLADQLKLKGMTKNDQTDSEDETALEYRTTVSALTEECLIQSHQKTVLKKEKPTNKSMLPKVKKEESRNIEGPVGRAFIEPETRAKIDSMVERRSDGLFACTKCEYISKISGHMKEHVEKHIQGLEYPCKSCNKVLTSSIGFRKHKRYHVKPDN